MARASRAHPTSSRRRSLVGMGVLSAQKVIAQTGMFGRQTHVQMLAGDSKHRTASASLLATASEATSCMFLLPCMRDARVPQACVWKAGSGGSFVRHHGNRCDLNEVTAPNGFRVQLVAMLRMHPACPLTRGRRDVRVSTVESHVARLFKFEPPMCSVRSRLGMGMPCDSCSKLLGR